MMATTKKQAVLVVDDDITFSSVLSRALINREYQVHIAYNSETAAAVARQHKIDKAILDLKIDQESGLTLIPILLSIQPNLQIVILTGYSSISTAVEAIKLGALNYLCKPADADQILNAFQTYANPELDIAEITPSVNRLTWEHIQRVLAEHNGNISATARSLGMHRRTLQRKLQKKPVKR